MSPASPSGPREPIGSENWLQRGRSFVCKLWSASPKLFMAFLTLVFGVLGFLWMYLADWIAQGGWPESPDRVLYRTLQLFTLESGDVDSPHHDNLFLILARMSAGTFFVLTVWSAIERLLSDTLSSLRLRFAHGHDVVCGLGRVGDQITDDILKDLPPVTWWLPTTWQRPRLVVIEQHPDERRFAELRKLGVIAIAGDATDEKLLERLNVTSARRLFVCSGSDDVNVEVVFDLLNLLREDRDPERKAWRRDLARRHPHGACLQCFVHVLDPGLCDVLIQHAARAAQQEHVELRVFNVVRNSVREFLMTHLLRHRPQEQHKTLLPVLIGFDPYVEELAKQIAELSHFANCRRVRLLIAAENPQQAAKRLLGKYGSLGPCNIADDPHDEARFAFHADDDLWSSRRQRPIPACRVEGDLAERDCAVEYVSNVIFTQLPDHIVDETFVRGLDRLFDDPLVEPVVVVCLPEDRRSFDAAVRLSERLWRVHGKRTSGKGVPVYVRLSSQPAFTEFLKTVGSATGDDAPPVRPFGSCTESAALKVLLDDRKELLAQRFHADYQRRYCDGSRDGACANWDSLAASYRSANLSAAAHALIKLELLGMEHLSSSGVDESRIVRRLDGAELELMTEIEHNRWMSERLLDGWRWGPTKSNDRKERPQIIPWATLSEPEREKDRTQIQVIFEVLNSGGMCVVRKG
ncbi:MAG: NAD(P)-binding protein [Planctomycetaceae bacterium]|nr:NAD(P)-binding protein [Planctomycetaceae bacterium]